MLQKFSSMGFRDPCIVPAEVTMIPDPVDLNIWERAGESVFVEAYNT